MKWPRRPLIPLAKKPHGVPEGTEDIGRGISHGPPEMGLDIHQGGIGVEDVALESLAPPALRLAFNHQLLSLLEAAELCEGIDGLPHEKTGGGVLSGLLQ